MRTLYTLLLGLLLASGITAQNVRLDNTVPDFSPATFSPYTITANGVGFTSGATVLWEGIPLSTTFVNSGQLTATVPCCFSGSVSTVHIYVMLPGGPTTSAVLFHNLGTDAPITSTIPTSFPQGGTVFLTVNGNYFTSGSQIYFDNIPQTTTFVSRYQLTTTVPGGDIDGRTAHSIRVQYPSAGSTVRLTPANLNFGNVTLGSAPSLPVSVANLAGTTLTIFSIVKTGSSTFGETHTCTSSLPPYTGCGFTVTFTPTGAGTFTGQITITDNGIGNPHVISLTGSGVGPTGPIASFSPTSLSFPNTAVGGSSSPQTVTLTNTGGSPMTITSVALGGTAPTNYGISDTCVAASPLAASASCTVDVTFSPLSAGILNAALNFTDSAPGSPQGVPLTGTGTSTHSVDVNWTASVSIGVTGYNVYRGTLSGGPYSQINSTLVSGTTYTDFTVTSGGHYCYVVTAYAPSGYTPQESVYSAESCSTVP